MKRDEYLFKKLSKLVEHGVRLFLNGKPATPDGVARKMAAAEGEYEPGFVFSEEGNLSELNYVRIA